MIEEQSYQPLNGEGWDEGAGSTNIPRLRRLTRHHGDNFSRWGTWWVAVRMGPDRKVFPRAKAASLVSAKRNGRVGDSTWPSQKTTLAMPW